MKILLAIAVGGAAGALLRHFASTGVYALAGVPFPLGTLFVNAFGSLAIGAFVEGSALVFEVPQAIRALIVTGLLGAFTTFSTFALDTASLAGRGETGLAVLYVALSVALCIGAFYAGMAAVRALVA